jgi:bifunctional DNA-binding transcriptional regulator/antitoxin component of YhaV-PrlF toxin-antitoxin module
MVVSKVTGKYQVTLPKRLVTAYGIKVGDEIEFSAAGASIALQPARRRTISMAHRLRAFDLATERQRARERDRPIATTSERGWSRAEVYGRGRTR